MHDFYALMHDDEKLANLHIYVFNLSFCLVFVTWLTISLTTWFSSMTFFHTFK